MKILAKISIFTIFMIVTGLSIWAKPSKSDTLAIAKLEKIALLAPNKVQFDLSLSRNNEIWKFFANATFQVSFPIEENVDYSKLKVEYIDFTSDLLNDLSSAPNYQIEAKPLDDRVCIVFLGPLSTNDSKLIKSYEKIRLGRFVITSSDVKPLPEKVFFKQPFDYYQACAFKYEDGGTLPDNILDASQDDNFEMFNKDYSEVVYQSDAANGWETRLNFFDVKYEGVLKVGLQFGTLSEYKTDGFFITRGLRTMQGDIETLPDAMFTDTIADYRYPQFANDLKGMFSDQYGKVYNQLFDLVPYRNVEFCYRLFYRDINGVVRKLATRLLPIPNAVITYAQANPNPFTTKTEIAYKLDDDVILTIIARDLVGKEIAKLTDESGTVVENVQKNTGYHKTFLSVSDDIAQGMYDVMFIAHPIKDPSVELSRAFVRVMRVKK